MKKYLIYCLLAIAVSACNSENKSFEENSDSTSSNLSKTDTLLSAKIVKTADMSFRVRNVQQTKEQLTTMLKSIGGSMTEFTIESKIEKSERVKKSTDSLIELKAYRTEGFMVAKVPSDKLDDFTNKTASLAIFVDRQSLKLEDKSIAFMSNQLKNQNRVEAVAQLNKHANKKSNNVATSMLIKDDYVDKKIENLLIDDKVKYSEITLNFYQDNAVQRITVVNDNLEDYRPGLIERSSLAISNGWKIFIELFLVVLNLWAVIVILILGYFSFYYFKRRKQTLKAIA
ncbi:hypothetical protein ACVWYN_000756 [Pedobacter sp. UYP24]